MSKGYNVTIYCELCGRPEIHDEMDCIDNLRGDLQKRDAEIDDLKAEIRLVIKRYNDEAAAKGEH